MYACAPWLAVLFGDNRKDNVIAEPRVRQSGGPGSEGILAFKLGPRGYRVLQGLKNASLIIQIVSERL